MKSYIYGLLTDLFIIDLFSFNLDNIAALIMNRNEPTFISKTFTDKLNPVFRPQCFSLHSLLISVLFYTLSDTDQAL